MKVLVITASLNQRSGWGRYGLAVIEELIAQGHDVSVVSEDKPDEVSFPVTKISPLHSRVPFLSIVNNARVVRACARDVEVVHALDGWPYGVYGLAAVVGTTKQLVINGVGSYAVAPLYAWGSSWLLRRAYTRSNGILCISNYTGKEIKDAGVESEKVHTVHMGAPILPSISDEEAVTLARAAGVPDRKYPIILTVGAVKERKGQFDTLRAIKILKKTYPDVLYIAAGSGSHKDYIASMHAYAQQNGLTDNFRIISNINDRTLSALYSICTVFTLNSNSDPGSHHFEGFGLVVLEAAQFGKPAVGSRDSGVEDTIEDGKSGFVAGQRDADDIAAKIQKILERYQFFSTNAKIWHSRFTWPQTVENYVRYYTHQ